MSDQGDLSLFPPISRRWYPRRKGQKRKFVPGEPTVYLFFGDRPDSFKAPHCDCTETCRECLAEGRTIGHLLDEERAERLARAARRVGHSDDVDAPR